MASNQQRRTIHGELTSEGAEVTSNALHVKLIGPDGVPVEPGAVGGRIDADNSHFTGLGAGETFTGEWASTDGLAALSFFAFCDQPFAELRLEWSDDGVNVATGLLATQDFLPSQDETGGFFIYYPDPSTYLLRSFYRVVAVNGATPQAVLEAYTWTFPLGAQPFAFLDNDAVPSTLQKALLTKPVNASLTISSWTDEADGTIPSGSAVTIDPVLNTEPNVLDSGWIETSTFAGKNIVGALTDVGVKVFLMNASDDQGANLFGDAAPTLTTFPGRPAQLSAQYADRFYRIVVCNDSGSDLTDYRIRSQAAPESANGLVTAIDQPVFGFFPAAIGRSVIMGRQPDGDYVNVPASGSGYGVGGAPIRTATPLPAGSTHTTDWIDTDGFNSVEVFISADAPSASSGVRLEYTSDTQAATPAVEASRSFTYDGTSARVIRLAPQLDGFRVVYINGPTGQNSFLLDVTLHTNATEAPQSELDSPVTGDDIGLRTRAAVIAPNDADEWSNLRRSDVGGLRTSLVEHETTTPIRALGLWDTRRVTVGEAALNLLPEALLADRRTLVVKNGSGTGTLLIAPTITRLAQGSGFPLAPQESVSVALDGTAGLWGQADGVSAPQTTFSRDGASTANNVGVVSPGNLLASDDARATFDATTDTVDVTGFTAARVRAEVLSLSLKLEGRKAAAPANQTVAREGGQSALSTGGTAVSTPASLVADEDHFYLAAVAMRDETRSVTSVVGMGLSWTLATRQAGAGGAVEFWYGEGTPTGGTVTANFDASVNAAAISASRWSGVDLTDPVFSAAGTSGSTAGWSVSTTGSAGQRAVQVAALFGTASSNTAGAPDEEHVDISQSGASNTRLTFVTQSRELATSNPTVDGTWATATTWAASAVVLNQSAAVDPVLRVEYAVGAEAAGPTALVATLDATSDTTFTQDVSQDRTWDFDDVDALTLTVSVDDVGVAPAEVDRVWIEVVEIAEGGTLQAYILEVGE